MDDNPISTARDKLYALKKRAPQQVQDIPPWVWVAVMGFAVLAIATVAVLSFNQRPSER